MNKRSLIHTNKYLRDPLLREIILLKHVISSSKIEGIRELKEMKKKLKDLLKQYNDTK